MNDPLLAPSEDPDEAADRERTAQRFHRQLSVATFGVLFVVLVIHLIQEFASILQPLLIAAFIGYALYPIHRWLVARGVRSKLAFAFILFTFVAVFFGVGQAVYGSIISITPEKVADYRVRVERMVNGAATFGGYKGDDPAFNRVRELVGTNEVSTQDVIKNVRTLAGTFFGFVSFGLVVAVYLLFLIAEQITFPRRLSLAFGAEQSNRLLDVVKRINDAIVNYIAVKAWISLVTAVMSLAVFLILGIEFAVVWAILVFMFNFVPYIGALVALGPPVLLSFVQFDSPWRAIVLIVTLVGIQLFTGQYLEPKLAGRRLNLSPLLILFALAFWFYLWGIVGMILAVPLTVVCKIVLDAIPETKPIGTLMSNV